MPAVSLTISDEAWRLEAGNQFHSVPSGFLRISGGCVKSPGGAIEETLQKP